MSPKREAAASIDQTGWETEDPLGQATAVKTMAVFQTAYTHKEVE
jgi:hypothetical protein